jgi:hypothetical protein
MDRRPPSSDDDDPSAGMLTTIEQERANATVTPAA